MEKALSIFDITLYETQPSTEDRSFVKSPKSDEFEDMSLHAMMVVSACPSGKNIGLETA